MSAIPPYKMGRACVLSILLEHGVERAGRAAGVILRAMSLLGNEK